MQAMAHISGYLTIQEAAPILGVDESTVTRYCQEQRLTGAKNLGKQWVIPEKSVRKFTKPPRGNPAFLRQK